MPTTTPETTAYLYLGLAAIALVMASFIGTMIFRYSAYRQDLERIRSLENLDTRENKD